MIIPRKQVAYGEKNMSYKFSNKKVLARCWHDNDKVSNVILKIKKKVEDFTNEKFNFVLINRYENGNNHINYHMDDEKEIIKESSIVGVTLGSQRDVLFKANKFQPVKLKQVERISLENGSIFIMKYPTNEYWLHSIPKRAGINKPRISLTFRKLEE